MRYAPWLMLVAAIALAGDTQELEKVYGFRDLKFETQPPDIKGVIFQGNEGDRSVYSRPSDILELEGVALLEIRYVFLRNRLYLVQLTTKEGPALFNALSQKYGQAREYQSNFYWQSPSVALYYYPPGSDGVARAEYFSRRAWPKQGRLARGPGERSSSGSGSDSTDDTCGPGRHWVSDYTKRDGTAVSGHCADNPS